MRIKIWILSILMLSVILFYSVLPASAEISGYRVYGSCKNDKKLIALTFDDGPSIYTEQILDVLKEYHVKATFFVVGKTEARYEAVYRRIVDEGHTLGMHSFSHKYNEIYASEEAFAADLEALRSFLKEKTGVECRFSRFPGGSSNTVSNVDMNRLITYLNEQGITYFDWNISSGDATSGYISKNRIIQNCTESLANYDGTCVAQGNLIKCPQVKGNERK